MQHITRARFSSLVAGAVAAAAASAGAQTPAQIAIGTLAIDTGAQPLYAKDRGFFARAGLDAQIQTFSSGPAIAAAVASGSLHFGLATIDTVSTIHSNGIPIVIVAPASQYQSPADEHVAALVLAPHSTITSPKQLEGKIIAASALRTLQETCVRAYMDVNGADSSKAKFVEIPFPAMPAALLAGRVDAAWMAEPFIEEALRNGRALTWGYDAIAKHFLISCWTSGSQWAKANADVVARFARAMHETALWANQNKQQSGVILAANTKIELSVIEHMMRADYADAMSPALVQPLIDLSAKYYAFKGFPASEIMYAPAM